MQSGGGEQDREREKENLSSMNNRFEVKPERDSWREEGVEEERRRPGMKQSCDNINLSTFKQCIDRFREQQEEVKKPGIYLYKKTINLNEPA